LLGAIINLILDPIFIYGLHMGVYGAAIATVISQGVSFAWVLSFFMGKKTFYHIKKENLILKAGMVGKITSLGISGFVMQGTNCLVQIVCNKMLFMYGGDIRVKLIKYFQKLKI
jgi:Na+-driven multidrug efflux pump